VKTFGRVELHGDRFLVTCEAQVVMRAKRVFGRMSKSEHGGFTLSNTPENAYELRWFVSRYPMTIDPPAALEEGAGLYEARAALLDEVLSGSFVPRAFEMSLPPRDYQRVAADLLLRSGSLLLADDVGTGKTASAIAALTDRSTRPALVVTMTHLPTQWRREIAKFMPGLSVAVTKTATPHKLTRDGSLPDVLITSYSKLFGWADALAGKVKAVVFDEVQELRIPDSAKYRAARHIVSGADYRMGLSATPIYNYGGEIYSVLNLLRPGALGDSDEFLREWCEAGYGLKKARIKEPRALGSYLRNAGLMLRRTRAEVGREIPPVTRVVHTIDADSEELEKVSGSAAALARIILAKTGSSFSKLKAAEELNALVRQATGIAKAPYVAEFVRLLVESGESVLLYGWHRQVYEIWKEKLADLGIVFYTGAESAKAKETAKEAFVSGRAKVMAMSLRAGAGVDGIQHACRTVVFGELDWSPGVHEQNIGRPARDGQTDPVCAYFLISDSGSDPIVADVLGVKQGQADGVRDPSGDVVVGQADPDRMRRLAEHFLQGIKAPKSMAVARPLELFATGGAA